MADTPAGPTRGGGGVSLYEINAMPRRVGKKLKKLIMKKWFKNKISKIWFP